MLWGDKRYYSLKYYLKNRYGENIKKIALDAGFTCPNRDGTLGSDGCIFCSVRGSGDTAGSPEKPVEQQIAEGIECHRKKYGIRKFIVYFQAFTNTYAEPDYLRKLYDRVTEFEEVVGISIATRPDCLSPRILDVLDGLNRRLSVWVELGLQTVHRKTADLINRRYPLSCFEEAVSNLNSRSIDVVCHTILGLPGESKDDMVETAKYLSGMNIQGIKFQLLHVLEGTGLADMFEKGEFALMKREDYVKTVTDCIEALSPGIVVHRLTGDGPKDILIGPLWSTDKIGVLKEIERELERRDTWQGNKLEP